MRFIRNKDGGIHHVSNAEAHVYARTEPIKEGDVISCDYHYSFTQRAHRAKFTVRLGRFRKFVCEDGEHLENAMLHVSQRFVNEMEGLYGDENPTRSEIRTRLMSPVCNVVLSNKAKKYDFAEFFVDRPGLKVAHYFKYTKLEHNENFGDRPYVLMDMKIPSTDDEDTFESLAPLCPSTGDDIARFIEDQMDGNKGSLLTNGLINLFLVELDGVPHSIPVSRNIKQGVWEVGGNKCSYSGSRPAGTRTFCTQKD